MVQYDCDTCLCVVHCGLQALVYINQFNFFGTQPVKILDFLSSRYLNNIVAYASRKLMFMYIGSLKRFEFFLRFETLDIFLPF